MANFRKPKIIIDPLLGLIDITDIVSLMDTEPFQSLGFKYQLGMTSNVFPAATHTRKQHSLGAYARTKRLMGDWLKYGFINEEQAHNLPIFALYHDIGHGPFSHVTESLGSVDHDSRGLEILKTLEGNIQKAGFDYELIYNIFARKDPLYLAVFDKNLGMEKLDYLERDAFYTIAENPGVEYLAHHVYFIDGKVAVSEVAVDQAKDIQDFYIKMYKHVYSRKKSAILQRVVEKMTYHLMQDGLTEKDLFSLTDFGLLGQFELSRNEQVKFYYDNFKQGNFPKLALELGYDNIVRPASLKTTAGSSDESGKPSMFVGLSRGVLENIMFSSRWEDVGFAENLEVELSKLIGIPEKQLMVVQPQAKKRIEPDDINVYTQKGSMVKISDIYPDHFQAMREYGMSHLSVRIAAYKEHRVALRNKAEEVKKFLLTVFND